MNTLLRSSAFFVSLLLALPAFGAARTFVASTGLDNTACSLVAPCRSFGAAIAVTDINGEVLVLDSAGYGVLTITKSVSVTAPDGVYAGISVPAGLTGIIVNGAAIKVTLRGLTINGQGGNDGIVIQNAGDVFIEKTTISNTGASATDVGLRIAAAGARVFITDTTVRGAFANGVQIEAAATVVVDRSRVEGNGNNGIFGLSPGGSLTVNDSLVARNANSGILVRASAAGTWNLTVARTTVEGNSGLGIGHNGGTAGTYRISITDSVVRNSASTGITIVPTAGETSTAMIVNNRSVGNATGIGCGAAGVSTLVAERNEVIGNTVGFGQSNCTFKSMGNNTVQNNGTDVLGVITGTALQ